MPLTLNSLSISLLATEIHAGPVPHLIWTVPFALLLLSIAIFPLVPKLSHWWESHHHKLIVGLVLGLVVVGHYAFRGYGLRGEGSDAATPAGWKTVLAVLEHALFEDYAPFMVLLFSLYTIAGGLHLRGDLRPTPEVNAGFLALGSILASLVGTTGASMLLIGPLVDANRARARVQHTIIFFIFMVSNIGGALTPLGDPPLFLGYLQGVPFTWTFRLWQPWGLSLGILLLIYYVWDRRLWSKDPIRSAPVLASSRSPIRLRGTINLVWLLGVVLSVALIVPGKPLPGTEIIVANFVREAVMLVLVGLSLATTPRGLRNDAGFTYGAMIEVACLFLGIFLTMRVPIEILQVEGSRLGLTSATHFFWACGSLSGVLDNAPTYMVFFETARTLPADGAELLPLLGGAGGGIRVDLLKAVSCGAVFMGALTYIGNGPNMMVKSIADARGVKMPSFFGYMGYSFAILLPLFAVVSLLFFA